MRKIYLMPTAESVSLSEKSNILLGSIPVVSGGGSGEEPPTITDPDEVLTHRQGHDWADTDA